MLAMQVGQSQLAGVQPPASQRASGPCCLQVYWLTEGMSTATNVAKRPIPTAPTLLAFAQVAGRGRAAKLEQMAVG